MPVYQFFVPKKMKEGDRISLPEDEALHFRKVLRGEVDSEISIVDGKGSLAVARVCGFSKKEVHCEVLQVQNKSKPSSSSSLVQSLLKPSKLEMLVEKATELGVDAIYLFPAEKSVLDELSEKKLQRLRLLSIAALKQSGGLFLPEICFLPPLLSWKALPFEATFFYGSLCGKVKQDTQNLLKENPAFAWVVGPESGFSEREEEHMQKLSMEPLSLHQHTLRAETASLIGLGVLQFLQQNH